MVKTLIVLAALCHIFLLSTAEAQALPARVKVNLFSFQKDLSQIYISGPVKLLRPQNQILPEGLFMADTIGGGIRLRSASNRHLVAGPVARIVLAPAAGLSQAVGLALTSTMAPRFYRGTVTLAATVRLSGPAATISINHSTIAAINEVDTYSYITSCVGAESLPSFSSEALKAQAVLSTTLLEKHYRGRPLNDSTEEQSYPGRASERPAVVDAVDKVFGQELFYDGRPIDVYFCSTCGGTTATPAIFGATYNASSSPYLQVLKCPFCKRSPFFAEHREFIDAAKFYRSLALKNPRLEKENEGRPTLVVCDSDSGQKTFSGYKFWLLLGQHFGWGAVPSTCYSIDRQRSGSGKASLLFRSRGCGHGVGLCQWGAQGQAQAGRGYKEILYFYFPGTKLKTPARRSFD